ncbi:MAG: phosphate-starvation-inducible PsiE family protein [Alphaproteobacteria bacterium]|nr:phosphate-starvation-inducible PsiE family protein [Alphaproteobacteria bacterium]
MTDRPAKIIDSFIQTWRELGFYERFEQIVAIFLTLLVSLIIFFACAQIGSEVYDLIVFKDDIAAPETFRNLFADILTVLIALEFNHSIVQVVQRRQSIIQVRTIVNIAILALVRKFILLDFAKTDAMVLAGLGAVVLALAALYWAVHKNARNQAG